MKADLQIRLVTENKRSYMPLLLLGDDQESLIEHYLDRGQLFVLEQNGMTKGVCVVTWEGPGLYELQNIAVSPLCRRQGLGRAMIDFVLAHYSDLKILLLGTGDSPSTVGFYRALGFREYKREKDYFLQHYDHPIYEDGKRLKDRVCFRKVKAP